MTAVNILEERRDEVQGQFAGLGDLRPGSLSRNFTRCGRPNCRCARDCDPGHPGHILRRSLKGQRKSIRIRAGEAEGVAVRTDEHRRFKAMAQESLEASEALADARLASGRGGDAKKGGGGGGGQGGNPSRHRAPDQGMRRQS